MSFGEAMTVRFPVGHEVLLRAVSCVLILVGISVTSFCLGRGSARLHLLNNSSRARLASDSPTSKSTRLPSLILLALTWILFLYSGVMIHGIGLSLSQAVCSAGFTACITLVLVSKGAWFIVLLEIAYVIWPNGSRHRSSNVYKLGLVPLVILVGMLSIGLYGRRTHIGSDGQCRVALEQPTSITILSLDLIAILVFSILFLAFPQRHTQLSIPAHRVAKASGIISLISLVTSLLSIGAITILNGKEFGWIFMLSCSASTCVQALLGVYITGLEVDHQATSRELEYPELSSPRLLPGPPFHSPLTISTLQRHTIVEEASPTTPRDTLSRKSDVTRHEEQMKGRPRAVWNEYEHEVQEDRHEPPLTRLPSRRRKLSKAKKRSQSLGEESSTILTTEVPSITTISIADNRQDTSTLPSFLFNPYQFPTLTPLAAQFPVAPPIPLETRRTSPTEFRPSSHPLSTTSEPNLAYQAKWPTKYQYQYRRRASSTGGDPVLPDADLLPPHSNLRKTPYPFTDEYDIGARPGRRTRGNSDVKERPLEPKISTPVRPRRPSEWDPVPLPEYLGAAGNRTTIRDAVAKYALIDTDEFELDD